MSTVRERVLHVLRDAPEGLTSQQLSDRLGLRPDDLSSRMSKLFAYGAINRLRKRDTGGRLTTTWQAKQGEP